MKSRRHILKGLVAAAIAAVVPLNVEALATPPERTPPGSPCKPTPAGPADYYEISCTYDVDDEGNVVRLASIKSRPVHRVNGRPCPGPWSESEPRWDCEKTFVITRNCNDFQELEVVRHFKNALGEKKF